MISAFVLFPAFILATFVGMVRAIPPPLPPGRQFWEDYCSTSSNIDKDVRYICFQTESRGSPVMLSSQVDDVNLAEAALDPRNPNLSREFRIFRTIGQLRDSTSVSPIFSSSFFGS
ncbi:uncharacterized protein UTRI_04986 [Ustilago trichophora]|uniref:Uncharacterized protein n=1 Tax=Ustilago trichophora TaxID=86804 RepID=A0A5C3EB18_9BASI|nr:uncharacterized protein UTRI_04986 [Ustilago trichophora]